MRNGFLTIAAALAISVTSAAAGERATATGNVTDTNGKPLERATVLVYEAHVKKGYSVYCPTCWVDCGKHSVTDAAGNFTIRGLNPDLVFKLLVVKDGYSATFVDNVDPAKGPAETVALKPRAPVEDASQVVRGRVVDRSGDPVKDAVVSQEGIMVRGPYGVGQSFGPMGWIDLMTATNEKGEFEMAYSTPAMAMTLSVNARGMAPRLVREPTGADRKTITVSEGAIIRGRLVQPDGKPMANAEVALSTHSRSAGTGFSEIRMGTKEDGTFAITGVPAGRIWYLYPKMQSLAERGLGGDALACETKDDGQQVDVGDIQLRPAYSIRGKVVLSDGQPIPPDMHVTLATDWGPDMQLTALAPDGSFQFKGLTKGVYVLAPGIKGYKAPDGSTGEVLVDHDRKDVTMLMEPASSRQ